MYVHLSRNTTRPSCADVRALEISRHSQYANIEPYPTARPRSTNPSDRPTSSKVGLCDHLGCSPCFRCSSQLLDAVSQTEMYSPNSEFSSSFDNSLSACEAR